MKENKYETKIIAWFESKTKYFIALMILGLLYTFGNVSYERYKCENVCDDAGYYSFRYKPESPRGLSKSACFCLTEAEAKTTNNIPYGKHIKF